MEEYLKLTTKISGEMWTEFKNRINADKTGDFWTDIYNVYSDIVERYKGTVGERYAFDMTLFYIWQLQYISRNEFNYEYTLVDFFRAVDKAMKDIRKNA